ncbi:MAG: hypothetical protein CMJ31_12915 [Phycisphaerae bacterium]|nr:hypothetical protein [Phycisphaerae bacterium]
MRTAKIASVVTCAAATTLAAQAQSYTTVFGPGGTVGGAPDTEVLNGLEAFTTFGAENLGSGPLGGTDNAGEILFFQVGAFYVGGAGPATSNPLSAEGLANLGGTVANNRAYGVVGEGRTDITFEPGLVQSLTLQIRGSEDGQTTGTNPATTFGGVPTALANAAGTLLVYTESGIQAELQISNADYQVFKLDATAFGGDSITRIGLVNQGPANSAVAIGELTATLVPAPGSIGLLATGGLLAARRRRHA